MSSPTTIREVSKLAGVSISTVSRVLNESGPVSNSARSNVLAAVEELNYQPNSLARGLVTSRSGGIGVSINSISSPFFSALLEGIETQIDTQEMHLLVANGRAEIERERASIRYLRQHADAVIAFVEAIPEEELITLAQNMKLVVIGRHIIEIADRCVYLDNEQGGYIATQCLIKHGHKRIAHISGPLQLPDSRARLQGYRQALQDAGIAFDERLIIEGQFHETDGQHATHRLLDRNLKISAIFAANDQMATGVLHALRSRNLEVPQDISLIGYDDLIFSRYLTPSLSTIRQPLKEMGEAAAQLAIAQLEGKEVEVKRKFDAQVIHRRSVREFK